MRTVIAMPGTWFFAPMEMVLKFTKRSLGSLRIMKSMFSSEKEIAPWLILSMHLGFDVATPDEARGILKIPHLS